MKIDELIIVPQYGPSRVSISQIITFEDIGIPYYEKIMRPVDRSHVKRLARSKVNWPPIQCVQIQFKNEEPYLLVDGRHRLEAAKMLKMETITVMVNQYDRKKDIIAASITANTHHGLPIQTFMPGDYVLWLLINDFTIEETAKIANLTTKEVQAIINKFEKKSQIEDNIIEPLKTDGQKLLDYLTRLRKRTDVSSVANEVVEAANDASDSKNGEYIDSLRFMFDILKLMKRQ